jgi:hypothetical protein
MIYTCNAPPIQKKQSIFEKLLVTSTTPILYGFNRCLASIIAIFSGVPSLSARQALIAHLAARGILAVFHYLPLHLSKLVFGMEAGRATSR